jgi:TonB family protein
MDRTYQDKQRSYRKRVLIATPVGVVLVLLLFLTSDIVPYRELEKRIGWEGETVLLPNITIVPDENAYEEIREESQRRTMTSYELEILDETGPAKGSERQTPAVEPKKRERPEMDFAEVRHYPVHTDVPYSEDYIILHMVQPEYPPRELLAGVEGDVTVEILVNEQGYVENAWVLSAMGPKAFQTSSLEAVRQFRFKPPIEDGEPIQMWIRFQVRFRLVG